MLKIKREKEGKCNICLEHRKLTWDHVPPKSGIQLSGVQIENIFKILVGREVPEKIISQNGVKYRTLCGACNSRLGHDYDESLNELNSAVSAYLQSSLVLPPYTYIKVKPVRLIRSIMGHLMAAKLVIDETVFDKEVREFLMTDTEPLPSGIHIHYWIYPYDATIIMRDFAIPAKRGDYSSFLFGHIMKYFPLAFLVSDKPTYQNLPSLSDFRNYTMDEETEIRIALRRVEPYDWPEKIDADNIVFASAETARGIRAKPR